MKKIGLIASVVVVCFLAGGFGFYVSAADKPNKKGQEAGPPTKATKEKTEKNVQNAATVNGSPILKSEYDAEVTRLDRQIAMTGRTLDEKEMSEMKQKILDNLVGRELLKQEAEKKAIKADAAEVSTQMDNLKKRFGTEEEYQGTLKKMNITEDALRKQFTSEIMLRKLLDQEVASKIVLAPSEAKEFYDSNPEVFKTPEMIRASHILVKVEQKAGPEEKAKGLERIKGIQKRIQDGADFAEVAKEVSDCPSKENGGDLDFFQKGQMVGPFETAAFSLKPGQVSDIVETEFGYHLIKLTDKKEPGVMTFEEMQPRIEQHVKSEKMSQQVTLYVDQLKSKAKIELLLK
ncbi:MAG: peptidylprolyl isomerase [Syntrophobacteraceae bacterium]